MPPGVGLVEKGRLSQLAVLKGRSQHEVSITLRLTEEKRSGQMFGGSLMVSFTLAEKRFPLLLPATA